MLISINERGMKTDFKILVYFITFLTPGKRVKNIRTMHKFKPSLFFINPNTCLENSIHTFLCPFCAYATFIHEAPGVFSAVVDTCFLRDSINNHVNIFSLLDLQLYFHPVLFHRDAAENSGFWLERLLVLQE